MMFERFKQQSSQRQWALITAFILFSIYTMCQHAYMISMPVNPEIMRQVYLLNLIGCFLGALLLPFLLPLNNFAFNRRTNKYKFKLFIISLFFLSNIIVRLLGQEVYHSNPINSGVMALGNGVIIILMYGLVFSQKGKYRLLWPALAFSAGTLVFCFLTGQEQKYLHAFLFTGTGLIHITSGVLLFIYLILKKDNQVTENEVIPNPDINNIVSSRINIPYFLFPFFAAMILFLVNSFTDQLFFVVRNSPFPPGFNPSSITLILTLPLLAFLATLSWRRFLMFFIPGCSVILLLAPALLLFTHSQPLFLILYTINTITSRMITAVFPFIMVDMFRQYTEQKKEEQNSVKKYASGVLRWLLPVSITMIITSLFIPANIFYFFLHDKAYSIILLTIAAIVFYFLMRVVNNNLLFSGRNADNTKNLNALFKEYKLTNSEIEVAHLLLEEGLSSEKIAERIFRSKATVASHLTNIFNKFNVKSRTEFIVKVLK